MKTKHVLLWIILIGLLTPPYTITKAQSTPLKIAFVSNRDGDYEIYIMDSDGSNIQQITFNDYDDMWPSWSPDGTQIVFTSDESGYSQIHVINVDGTNEINLFTPGRTGYEPTWSPAGDKIAFTSSDDDLIDDILVMNVDGSNPVNLTAEVAPRSLNQSPSWVPDGSQIIFRTTRENKPLGWHVEPYYDAYIMNADGSNQNKLMFAGFELSEVSSSPDGTHITYSIDSYIYIANADGSDPAAFSPSTDVNGVELNWVETGDGPPIEYMVALDPDWSPAGEQIVFSIFTGHSMEIAIADADGTDFQYLTNADRGNIQPVWQPVQTTMENSE